MKRTMRALLILVTMAAVLAGMIGILTLLGCDDGGLGVTGVEPDPSIIGTDTSFSDVASTYGSFQRLASVGAVAADTATWDIVVSVTGSTNGPATCKLSVFLDGAVVPDAGTITDVAAAGLWQSDYTAGVNVDAGAHTIALYLSSDMGGYTCSVHASTDPSKEAARLSVMAHTQ